LRAQIEEQLREASGGRAGEREAARVEEDFVVFAGRWTWREWLMAAESPRWLRNSRKSRRRTLRNLAGFEGFGSHLVGEIVEGGGEAEHVAGHGDFEDHGAASREVAASLIWPLPHDKDAAARWPSSKTMERLGWKSAWRFRRSARWLFGRLQKRRSAGGRCTGRSAREPGGLLGGVPFFPEVCHLAHSFTAGEMRRRARGNAMG